MKGEIIIMAYTKKTWVKGNTPLSAENFNHMEQGIADAHTDIAQLNSDKAYIQPPWLISCDKFEGGYFKINNVVFVNIQVKTSAASGGWAGSGTWKPLFNKLPAPALNVPLQCYCETYSDKYTPCYIAANGTAYVMGANQIEAGTTYLFQTVYLTNE